MNIFETLRELIGGKSLNIVIDLSSGSGYLWVYNRLPYVSHNTMDGGGDIFKGDHLDLNNPL